MKPALTALVSLAGLSAVCALPGAHVSRAEEFQLPHGPVPPSPAHARLIAMKQADWAEAKATSAFSIFDATTNAFQACTNGLAGGLYPCSNVDLHGYLSHAELGDTGGNDSWGWVSDDGREIAIIGQVGGVTFLEILPDGSLKNLGRLPARTQASTWRGIKVIDSYAYIGSEAVGHGMQVFDLRKVLNNTSPVTYALSDQTAHYTGFGRSHNIIANAELKRIYGVGSRDTCSGGLIAVDVSDPTTPTTLGCFSGDGYVHESQCVVYRGPDTRYQERPICVNFNEDTLTITDHSDEQDVQIISRTGYPEAAYTHQGWFASDAQDILLLDDELDERDKTSENPSVATTYFWNLTDLTRPVLYDTYSHTAVAIDHNLYTKDGYAYHANYASGLRVTDVRNVASGPGTVSTVAYFDVWPAVDSIAFVGSWSVYPFFESGYIIVNTIGGGVFSVKRTDI